MAAPRSARSPEKARGTHLFLPASLDQRRFLVWLQRTHAWLGLLGAAGLLVFLVSGFVLNHGKQLRIDAARTERTETRLAVPTSVRDDVQGFTQWLQGAVGGRHRLSIEVQSPKPVEWGSAMVEQPRRFKGGYEAPHAALQADYVVGNAYVTVKRQTGNGFAMLNRLHVGKGVGPGWVLFADVAALGMAVLSLTGILLWSKLHGRRLLAAGLGLGSLFAALGAVLRATFPG